MRGTKKEKEIISSIPRDDACLNNLHLEGDQFAQFFS
jgi:hypothetical protein